MQRRNPRYHSFVASVLVGVLLTLFLVACGSNSAATPAQQHVTLKFTSWIGSDQLPIYQAEIKRFEALNSNITVDYEVLPYAQYEALLKARFNAGNAPDVLAILSPAFRDEFASAHDLVDLSNQPWVSRIVKSAKSSSLTSDGTKTVAMPISLSAVAVVYNKQLFAAHHIAIPTTWAQFLQACATLKQAGVAPITMGAKDTWPLAYIPDLMTMQSVYKNTPTFDAGLTAGKSTYAGSQAWVQALTDTKLLSDQGYLYKNILGTSYQDSEDLLAAGKAAMTISGQFSVATAKQTNPSVDLGMFPLPYAGGTTVATYVDVTLGIASSSKHVAAAEKFLQYWADPANSNQYLSAVGSFPTFSGINPPTDPAYQQLNGYVQSDSRDLSLIVYPGQTNAAVEKGIQSMWSGTQTPLQVAQAMDKAVSSS